MSKTVVKKINKPWGYELIWADTSLYLGKILHINQGHRLSLQYHQQKVESFFLLSGKMTLVIEDAQGILEEVTILPGEAHHIPALKKHRMIAVEDCDVLEVSTPHALDVVRLEDTYGREGTQNP